MSNVTRSVDGGPPTCSESGADPRPAAVTFATTEHFTLQGARASTIAESTGRATMFLQAVSGGLVGLGLIATASRAGTVFYAFGLVVVPTLAFIGLVTFERTLQSGIEDHGYARRIALLRAYYFDQAPELTQYLLSVAPEERLRVQGLSVERGQGFRTVAGMVAVITAVLAGSAVALAGAVVLDHSLAGAVVAGGVASMLSLGALMRYQRSAWQRAASAPLSAYPSGEADALAPSGGFAMARTHDESNPAPPPADDGPVDELAGFTHRHADLNGVRLHYVIGGSGPAVMLVHGWAVHVARVAPHAPPARGGGIHRHRARPAGNGRLR